MSAPVTPSTAPFDGVAIGEALRRLRRAREMTVAQLAERVDLSKGYISLVESGKRAPHWSTLMRMVHALDETLCRFLTPADAPDDTQCRSGRSELIALAGRLPDEWGRVAGADAEGYTWIVTPDRDGRLSEVIRFRLPARAPWTPAPISYFSYTTAIGLEGGLLLELGGTERDEFMIAAGETLQFDGRRPHRFRNVGDEPAEALLVLYPVGI